MPLATQPGRVPTLAAVAMAVVIAFPGCGSDRTGGPRGSADEVVGGAAAATVAELSARFEVGLPRDKVVGVVDFTTGKVVSDTESEGLPRAADPLVALALLEGVVDVVSYGGQAIRGASAFRYELNIAPEKAARSAPLARRPALDAIADAVEAPTMFGDVWVDSAGRVLRIQVPVDPATPRPRGADKTRPDYMTVDYFDFGAEVD